MFPKYWLSMSAIKAGSALMTVRQLTAVTVRLFALGLLLNYSAYCIAAISTGTLIQILSQLFGWLFILAVAIVLWRFPLVITHRLIPAAQMGNTLKLPLWQTAQVACIVLGMWLLIRYALWDLSNFLSSLFSPSSGILTHSDNDPAGYSLIRGVANASLAFTMMFKSAAITHFLLGGQHFPPPDEEA